MDDTMLPFVVAKPVEATIARMAPVFVDIQHRGRAQSAGVAPVRVCFEPDPVVARQAVLRAEPQKTATVAQGRVAIVVRQSVVGAQVGEVEGIGFGLGVG